MNIAKDKKYFIEVEVMGQPSYIEELKGQAFPFPHYGFTAMKCDAKKFDSREQAEKVARTIGWAHAPQIVEEGGDEQAPPQDEEGDEDAG